MVEVHSRFQIYSGDSQCNSMEKISIARAVDFQIYSGDSRSYRLSGVARSPHTYRFQIYSGDSQRVDAQVMGVALAYFQIYSGDSPQIPHHLHPEEGRGFQIYSGDSRYTPPQ